MWTLAEYRQWKEGESPEKDREEKLIELVQRYSQVRTAIELLKEIHDAKFFKQVKAGMQQADYTCKKTYLSALQETETLYDTLLKKGTDHAR